MHFMSGFGGEDSMREKARKMFGEEGKTNMNIPQSASSKSREQFSLYRKGGHVKHHKMSHEQHDLKLPRRMHTPKLNPMKFEKAEHMKHGGKTHHKHHGKHHVRHAAMGGSQERMEGDPMMGGYERPNFQIQPMPRMDTPTMKRGGKAHHKHHAKHFDMGGMTTCKHGGNVHPRHHKAAGGTVYEREMVGEHPSHKRPHFNYEADMRGEHGKRYAKGGPVKMAIGGVGKIRHKQSNGGEQPLSRHHVQRDAYLGSSHHGKRVPHDSYL